MELGRVSTIVRGLLCCLLLMVQCAWAAEVPSSARSRNVIERQTPQLSKQLFVRGLRLGDPIYIRTFKKEHKLEVWMKRGQEYRLFKTYDICRFSGDLGPKLRTGDRQAPEGIYAVTPSRMNPDSRYHLSFNVGFPNRFDRSLRRTGHSLMIHGGCRSVGCYAMTDRSIEEIYTLAEAAFRRGQPYFEVHAMPFRMTWVNMATHRHNQWYGFWLDLKRGYDYFEENRQLPAMGVRKGRYVLIDNPRQLVAQRFPSFL